MALPSGCAGCGRRLTSRSEVGTIDYPPGDPGHDDDVRYWCEECFLDHQDGHPGDTEKQQRCSPETCPQYIGTFRV